MPRRPYRRPIDGIPFEGKERCVVKGCSQTATWMTRSFWGRNEVDDQWSTQSTDRHYCSEHYEDLLVKRSKRERIEVLRTELERVRWQLMRSMKGRKVVPKIVRDVRDKKQTTFACRIVEKE